MTRELRLSRRPLLFPGLPTTEHAPTAMAGMERFVTPIFRAMQHVRLAHNLWTQRRPLSVVSSCGATLGEVAVWESFGIQVRYESSDTCEPGPRFAIANFGHRLSHYFKAHKYQILGTGPCWMHPGLTCRSELLQSGKPVDLRTAGFPCKPYTQWRQCDGAPGARSAGRPEDHPDYNVMMKDESLFLQSHPEIDRVLYEQVGGFAKTDEHGGSPLKRFSAMLRSHGFTGVQAVWLNSSDAQSTSRRRLYIAGYKERVGGTRAAKAWAHRVSEIVKFLNMMPKATLFGDIISHQDMMSARTSQLLERQDRRAHCGLAPALCAHTLCPITVFACTMCSVKR